jgi:hypothetical protein
MMLATEKIKFIVTNIKPDLKTAGLICISRDLRTGSNFEIYSQAIILGNFRWKYERPLHISVISVYISTITLL